MERDEPLYRGNASQRFIPLVGVAVRKPLKLRKRQSKVILRCSAASPETLNGLPSLPVSGDRHLLLEFGFLDDPISLPGVGC